MSGFSIRVDGAPQTQAALDKWLVEHVDLVRDATKEAAIDTQASARRLAPSFDGRLRASIRFRPVDDWLGAEVFTDVDYASYVEYGTRPHFPPVDALRVWAAAKGISPWALAYSIKKHGTRAHPYMRPAWEEAKPKYYEALVEAMRV